MLPYLWLANAATPLPDPRQIKPNSDGLIAVGLDLSVERLEEAYGKGMFPWFSHGQPVLWWSPDPRMVLKLDDFRLHRSLVKTIRSLRQSKRLEVWVDRSPRAVLEACAAPRAEQSGTWIVPVMQAAYLDWHRHGRVHTIETWIDGQLVGGLYGVSLNGMFFGESMFSRASNASKIALAHLVARLQNQGVRWIDCQQETAHLAFMGAKPVPRVQFLDWLVESKQQAQPLWSMGLLDLDGYLEPLQPET